MIPALFITALAVALAGTGFVVLGLAGRITGVFDLSTLPRPSL